ncbi:MAG: hypothetical protein ABIY52_04280 [Gemmatimonadaceae bacterium]
MNNHRQLAPAAYLVAALLVFIPLYDAATSLYPFNVASSQWRFGAFGLLSNALMLPASGALIAVAAAAAFMQPRMLRFLGIVSWVAVVVIVLSMVLFALDAVQSRRLIRADMQLSYMVATATALVKLVLGALGFALLARGTRPGPGVMSESRSNVDRAFPKRASGAVPSR